jgi:flagellar hook-associated protein 3 FlgL
MKTTFISSTTLWNSPRSTLDKMQSELVRTNKELVTGRSFDVGLRLGYRTGEAISLRQERAEIDSIIDGNISVKLRLDSSTATLSQLRTAANDFMDSLIATPVVDSNMTVVKYRAEANLNNLIAGLNKETDGQYIFGGINTKEKPISSYSRSPASPAKTEVNNAFSADASSGGFGISQDDPAVADISAEDMKTFLDGPFADLFSATNWSRDWSKATSRNITSMISPGDKIETSANANEKAFRDIAMAYTMAFDLGIANMNSATKEVVISKVIETLSGAITALSDIEANIGVAKEKLETANDRMDLQRGIFEEKLSGLEGVDPTEAKVKVDQLMTQIQTSFSLTSQLRQLNLINYL